MENSSIKFLSNKLLYLDNEFDMNLIDKKEYFEKRKKIVEIAEEIHKYEIINANIGKNCSPKHREDAEDYYNKTFKSE